MRVLVISASARRSFIGLLAMAIAVVGLPLLSAVPASASVGTGVVLGGTVTGPTSAPLSGIEVQAFRVGTGGLSAVGYAITAADGTWQLPGVGDPIAAGSFEIQVYGGTYPDRWYPAAETAAGAIPVTLVDGQVRTDLNVALTDGYTIAGHVTIRGGASPAGVVVTAQSTGYQYPRYATVAGDGSYVVTGLSDGDWTVLFSGDSSVNVAAQYYPNTPSSGRPTPLNISGASRTGIDAELAPGATISGTVILTGAAAGTNPSIPEVFVAGTTSQLGGLGSVISADGTYTLSDVPAGSYDVRFRQQGYATQWWTGQAGQSSATAIPLGEGGAATSVNAALTVERSVSGAVTDVHGSPLPGEDVSIGSYYDDQYQDTSSDGGGAFTLSGIRPSKITIAANSYGDDTHLSVTKDVTVATIDVTGVALELPDAGVVTGHIHRLDNSAVSNAEVTLESYDPTSGWSQSSSIPADFNGAFRFGSLVPGTTYRVLAHDVTGAALDNTSAAFVVAAGPQVEDVVMAPGGSISGIVTGPGGTPLGGISVAGASGTVYASTISDGAGHYTLSPLPTGTYDVTFTGGTSYLDSTASGVSVTQPATTSLDRQLAAASIIKGTVVDGHGVPVGNVPVSVQSAGAVLSCGGSTTQTASDGSFTVGGLASGSYVVAFGNPDPTCSFGSDTIVGEYWQDRNPGQTPTPVVLAAGTTATIAAQVTRYSVLTGTVSAGGNPLGNVTLLVWPVGAASFLTSTAVDASGGYRVALPPGDYKLQITSFSSDQRRPDFWYSSTAHRVLATVVTVGLEADQSGLDISAPFTGALSGHVTASGVPAPNANVTVYDSRDRWVSDTTTDQQGAYSVGGLPSGQYRINVNDYSSSYGQNFWVGGTDFESATVQNVTDGATTTVDIAEPPGSSGAPTGTMSFTVTAGATPAAGQVSVVDAATGNYVASCSLDSGGLCSGLAVPAGSYKVQATSQSAGYADTWYGGTTQATATVIAVTAGTNTPVTLALRGAGSIDVTVSNDSAANLSYVAVSARQTSGGDAAASGQLTIASGASSNSTLTNLPAGTYQVTVSHQGEVTTTSVTVTAGVTTPASLSLISADVSGVTATITGIVQDSQSVPVSGASVCTDSYRGACGTTAADGTYSITGVQAGYYGLQVSGLPVGLSVQTTVPTVLVDPQQSRSVAAPTITAVAGATATGTVTRSGATPASDVRVRLWRGTEVVGEAFTGVDGGWSVSALPPGSYNVEADAQSDVFEPTWYPHAAIQSAATAVALKAGLVTASLNITLTDGKAGARVSLASSTATGVGSTVTLTATVVPALTGGATPSGSVQFNYAGADIGTPVPLNGSGVATTTVQLSQTEAEAGAAYGGSPTYGVATGGTSITATGIATTTALVSPPTTATAGANVSLTASVGDVGPGAAPTGWVDFFTDGETWLGTTRLSAGNASISTSALFAGSHVIWASYGGDATHQGSISPDAPLAVSAVGPTLGHIQGTVTSGPAQPVANVTVDLYAATGPAFVREATTGSNGAYAFGALPAGSYLIRYSGSGITTEWWQDQAGSGTASPLAVSDGVLTTASPTVTILAAASGSVSGTVTAAAGGAPVASAWVQACTTTLPTLCGYAQTDSAGAYSVGALADGTYHVLIQPWGVGLAQSDADVNVAGGGNVTNDASLPALLVPPAPVTVTAADGVTSDNVPTATWNDTTPFSYDACAAGSGTYTVTDASNATVTTGTLTEGPAGHYTAIIPALNPVVGMLTVSASVVCPSGPPATVAFNLYIDPSGNVVDTHGIPLSGATVTLSMFDASTSTYVALPSGSDVMSPSNRTNPDLTDGNGHFGWNVQAGHYKVTASKAGCYRPGASGTPEVSTGDLEVPPAVTDVNLVLQCSSVAVAPGAPTGVIPVAGPASATVSWSAPASDGGSPVTGYTVTATPGGASCSSVAPITACTLTGLSNGTSYTFTVTATNSLGTSGSSAASSPVTPRTVPGAPSGVVAVAGHGSALVSWTPGSDGGSVITGYTVTASPGGASCSSVVPTTSCSMSGLTNGVPYTFTVTASNVAGASTPSAPSAAVTPTAAPVAPGAPVGVAAVAGHGSATVTWSAPGTDGGSAVTGYTATGSPGGASCTVAAPGLSCTVAGLSNGTAYTFTVTAMNSVGTSGPSAPSAAVTPTAVDVTAPTVSVPALPMGTVAASVRVVWLGADAGSGVASYDVQYRRAAWNAAGFGTWVQPAVWQHTTARSGTLALAVGVDYCVSVRARDVAGNVSGWSVPRCVARALDDRAMVASAGWTRSSGTPYYLRTVTSTSTVGKVLTRTGARLDRVGIVATRCAKCGVIGVYVGAKLIGKINLASATTKRQQLIMLAPFSYRAGTITIKTLTTGKLVQLDGLLITRS